LIEDHAQEVRSMSIKATTAAVLLFASTVILAQGREGTALDTADADRDGKITKQEYVDARATQFAKLDRNSDGFIDDADSRDDAERSQRGKRVAAAIRGRLDANDDGKIDKTEFVSAPTMLFDRFDSDKNDVLDAKELDAARSAAQERLRDRKQ
jgi:hypothetical protein